MRLHKLEKGAIAEQLASPSRVVERLVPGTATPVLVRASRRRTENILVSMIDRLGRWVPPDPENKKTTEKKPDSGGGQKTEKTLSTLPNPEHGGKTKKQGRKRPRPARILTSGPWRVSGKPSSRP